MRQISNLWHKLRLIFGQKVKANFPLFLQTPSSLSSLEDLSISAPFGELIEVQEVHMAHRPQEVSNLRFLRSEVFAMAFKIQWRPRIMDAEFLPLLPLQGADTFRVPNLIGLRGCNVICDGLRPSMWMTLLYRVIYFACTNHHKLLRR